MPAYPTRRASHEFIITLKRQARELDVTAMDFAKRLLDHGFHAPTTYFPLLVPECLLIEPTETESKDVLDAFIEAMVHIQREAEEEPEHVRGAPHTMPVRRLDDVRAAKQLDLTWKPTPPPQPSTACRDAARLSPRMIRRAPARAGSGSSAHSATRPPSGRNSPWPWSSYLSACGSGTPASSGRCSSRPMLLVLVVELLNSAIEATVDRIGLERHVLAGLAKDIGSAAVLMSFILLGVVWLLVLLGR